MPQYYKPKDKKTKTEKPRERLQPSNPNRDATDSDAIGRSFLKY
jgi:hypothetical protein